MLKKGYHILACLAYIHQVKACPFHEHSNQLWDISCASIPLCSTPSLAQSSPWRRPSLPRPQTTILVHPGMMPRPLCAFPDPPLGQTCHFSGHCLIGIPHAFLDRNQITQKGSRLPGPFGKVDRFTGPHGADTKFLWPPEGIQDIQDPLKLMQDIQGLR
jgi:hypothetical protein